MLGRSFCRRVEKAYNEHVAPAKQDIFINWDEKSFYLLDPDGKAIIYKPTKTAVDFHSCDDLYRIVKGPYGSGKTTQMLVEILFRSCKMPKSNNGTRYSRWAIIRNTYAELESTTYVSWMAWFSSLGKMHKNKKPILTVRHKFNDGEGDIELELLFLALDTEESIGKLKSLEVCGAYMNETSELPEAIFAHLKGRIGRYMLNTLSGYWKGIIMDSNPPSMKHWIYKKFELDKPQGHTIFNQPPGLLKDADNKWISNPEADNYCHLPNNYYVDMTHGASEEFINVYCLGKYGIVINAKKVYNEYNDDIHSVDFVPIDKDRPIYIGMDFGLTPAAIFVQETVKGTYNIVYELVTEHMGVKQFVDNVLSPFLSRECADMEIGAIVGDPAGDKKNENDLTSCFDVLHDHGFRIIGALTNLIRPRIDSVKEVLNQMVEGVPRFLLSRSTCPVLREGFLGGYSYKALKIMGETIYDSKPNKNEFSHPHDGLQYIILHLNNQIKVNQRIAKTEITSRKMRF